MGLDAVHLGAVGRLDGGWVAAGDRADGREADAGVLERRARRVHPGRGDRGHAAGDQREPVLPAGVRVHDPRRVRRRDAGELARRGTNVAGELRRSGPTTPAARRASHDLPALAGRHPADGRVHREGGRVRRGHAGRALAARADRGPGQRHRGVLLPARDRPDVHAGTAGRSGARAGPAAHGRRRGARVPHRAVRRVPRTGHRLPALGVGAPMVTRPTTMNR